MLAVMRRHPRCLLALVLAVLRHCRAADGSPDRSGAFIGYQEAGSSQQAAAQAQLPACRDSQPSCAAWAADTQCVANPYYMRSSCPVSCHNLNACSSAGYIAPDAWHGWASEEDTRLLATKYPGFAFGDGHYRRDPSLGSPLAPGERVRGAPWLFVSSLGAGTYLGPADAATDELVTCAILESVSKGWNLIDTAPNYRGGRAEDAVGAALDALRTAPFMKRGMLFLSTKAGFLADEAKEELTKEGTLQPGELAGGSHCLHPHCLEVSLRRSLFSLNVRQVDVLYLHNAAEVHLPAVGRPRFMQRLRAAFAWLETQRAQGTIQAYGMATWECFRRAPGAAGYLALADVVALAHEVGGPAHGFRYIQVPINVGMPEAWREAWQPVPAPGKSAKAGSGEARGGALVPLVEAAARLGVGVFGSAPLQEGQLLADTGLAARLDAIPQLAAIQGTAAKLLQVARSTPYVIATIVGHKAASHVAANTAVTLAAPLTAEQFQVVQKQLGNLKADN